MDTAEGKMESTNQRGAFAPPPETRQYAMKMGRTLAVLLATILIASPAAAHIKWFEPFDVSAQPKPLDAVLSPTFVTFFLISVVLVYLFFVVDRIALRRGVMETFHQRLKVFDGLSILIMRGAAGLFFASTWAMAIFGGIRFYLAPELIADEVWLPWFQLALALCALSRWTTPLLGAGILLLYALALHHYGVFHLIDYLIFPAVAYFFMATASASYGWKKSGFVTLYAVTGINFLWLSIEKFAFPDWTYPLLAKHPALLMGIAPETYMVLAGFVEFVIIFTLLGAASVATRLIAFAFQTLLVLGIFEFGLVDAIGHLMINAVLFVLIVRGPTDARYILVLSTKSPQMEAYFMTGLYYLAFVNAFILYYGLHALLQG
tara:strand:- start:1192 stop:2319 length:1128 start_codon:yes stop_codon:yes gene_type:complete